MTDRQTLQVAYQECKNKVENLQQQIHDMRNQRQDEQFLQISSSKKNSKVSRGQSQSRSLSHQQQHTNIASSNPLRTSFRIRRRLTGHYGKIYALQWCSSDETAIVSASQDGKLMIWNGHTENKSVAIPLRSAWVMTCCYSPSGCYVACGGLDNTCSVYNIKEDTQGWEITPPYRELQKHEGYIACCRFLDETHILSASGDSTILLWDVVKQSPLTSFMDHSGDVMGVSVSPHPNRKNIFVSVSVDETAKVWDLRLAAGNNNNNNNNGNNKNQSNSGRSSSQCVGSFTGHASDVNCCDWFPDGYAFATGSDDATVRLFDTRAYRQLNVYGNSNVITCGVTSVRFSSSGKYLFSGYDERPFMVSWDTLSAGATQDFSIGLQHRISCLDVNSVGKAIATGSWDCNVRIWS